MKIKMKIMMIFGVVLMLNAVMLAQNVTEPEAEGEKKAKIKEKIYPIKPSGFRLVNRQGELVFDTKENRWFLMLTWLADPAIKKGAKEDAGYLANVKDPNSAEPWALEVLPGKWLTTMTKLSGKKESEMITFRVWGEMTVYHNRNFIFPSRVATDSIFGKLGQKKDKDKVEEKEETDAKKLQARKNEAKAQKMRDVLLKIPRTHVVKLAKEESLTAVDPGGSSLKESSWKEGSSVRDRRGRLQFDTAQKQYTFVFDSDSNSLAEPPVYIHPNKNLEEMEKLIKGTSTRLKFRVSGRISTFQGKAYILIDKQLVTYDSGNFGL